MSTTAIPLNRNTSVAPVSTFQKIYQSSLSIMILTLIHHAYGALIYEDPFRLHVMYGAIPVILIQLLAYRKVQGTSSALIRQLAFAAFMLISVVISVCAIGLYEGGYNHLLKNLLYFGGATQATLDLLFPPAVYEMPGNYFFEVTGIFQFVFGMYGIYCLIQYWKEGSG